MLSWAIWLLVTTLYAPVFIDLYKSRWETIDYTHAYFILPISIWIAWRNLKNHNERNGSVSIFSLFLLIFGLLMFIFGWRQDYGIITTFSLIPLLFGLTGFLYGVNTAKTLSFPILYLLLLVPPPLGVLDAITIPMRQWATTLSVGALKALHYPILRDGLIISIGSHEIYMGPACSGFRSLITMISLGIVYAYVNKGAAKTKLALVLAIIPLALLGNLIRVMGVCMVTFHFGESIGHKFHDISGFLIFLILILGLMGIQSLMEKIKNYETS